MIKQRLLPKELVCFSDWFNFVFICFSTLILSLFGVLHLEFDHGRTPHATPTTLSFLPWPMAK